MNQVVDASVALKWFFRGDDAETGHEAALQILAELEAGQVRLLQPPHFLAEVAAVLARRKPSEALADLRDLQQLEVCVADDRDLYLTAADLAIRLDAHVFDTLYHAVALHHPGAELVTADRRYHRRAAGLGQIRLLD